MTQSKKLKKKCTFFEENKVEEKFKHFKLKIYEDSKRLLNDSNNNFPENI